MSCAYLVTCRDCGACAEVTPGSASEYADLLDALDEAADDATLDPYERAAAAYEDDYTEAADPESWVGACRAGEVD